MERNRDNLVVVKKVDGQIAGDIDLQVRALQECSLRSLFPGTAFVQCTHELHLQPDTTIYFELISKTGEKILDNRYGKSTLEKKVEFYENHVTGKNPSDLIVFVYYGADPVSVSKEFHKLDKASLEY